MVEQKSESQVTHLTVSGIIWTPDEATEWTPNEIKNQQPSHARYKKLARAFSNKWPSQVDEIRLFVQTLQPAGIVADVSSKKFGIKAILIRVEGDGMLLMNKIKEMDAHLVVTQMTKDEFERWRANPKPTLMKVSVGMN